jgi:putative hydrolase of HD superfamily
MSLTQNTPDFNEGLLTQSDKDEMLSSNIIENPFFKSIADNDLKKLLSFIFECDKIKNIFRRNLIIDGSRHENDAEHSWHLSLMAILLLDYSTEKNISLEHVLKMVTVHDMVEIYAGDTFAYDTAGIKNKEHNEKLAQKKLCSQLPEEQAKELKALWNEFDSESTPDARYAAAIDHLQPFTHNVHTNGYTWIEGHVTESQVRKRIRIAEEIFPSLIPWIDEQIKHGISQGWIKHD